MKDTKNYQKEDHVIYLTCDILQQTYKCQY